MISNLRGRTDSESSTGKLQQDVEQSVNDFKERAPLIESLQRELSSAQVHQRVIVTSQSHYCWQDFFCQNCPWNC